MFDGSWLCVAWAHGHLLSIATPDQQNTSWARFSLEDLPLVPPGFAFRYEPTDTPLLEEIRSKVRVADEVINACDAGREGELIFAEILQYCGCGNSLDFAGSFAVTRMWIKSTTAPGVREAWAERESESLRRFRFLREAGLARAQADWIWGISLSRYATILLNNAERKRPLAIGRVQTPVLFLVFDRCREVREFVRTPFYRIEASFRGSSNKSFTAEIVAFKELRYGHVDTHFATIDGAIEIKRQCMIHATMPWAVHDEEEAALQYPHPPFDLVELQRVCARIFHWSGKKTLTVAQVLYETDHAISYPRTESNAFPENMRADVMAVWRNLWKDWALREFPKTAKLPPVGEPTDEHFDDKRVSDHYAIMPTGVVPPYEDARDPGNLRDEYMLWRLISARFLLAWLPPAQITVARRILLREFHEDTMLRAVLECKPVKDPAWLVYEDAMMNTMGLGPKLEERMHEEMFPACARDARIEFANIITCKTEPPHYIDDDSLLGYMKKLGLGTAATRAEVINGLIESDYITLSNGHTYRSTFEGNRLIELLTAAQCEVLFSPGETEYWEKMLNRMEKQVPNRPTRELFLENIVDRVREVGTKLAGLPVLNEIALDPDTGLRVTEDEKTYLFPKKSRYFGIRCPKVFAGRQMTAKDYVSIFTSGSVGGGPFEFKSKKTGAPYPAWLVFRPNLKSFDFVFKSR